MGFLSMNWLWISIAIGVAFYLFRRKSGAHTGGYGADVRNLLDGLRRGGQQGHGGHAGHDVPPSSGSSPVAPEAAIDAVGGEPVSTAKALTSLHQGRVYYFSSKENRDRFEASPEEYAAKVSSYPVPGPGTEHVRRHRHGC